MGDAPVVFAKKKRPNNARKRPREEEDVDQGGSAVVRVERQAKSNPLVQSTAKPKEKDDLTFKSSRVMEAANGRSDATRVLEIDTQAEQDARAQFERKKKLQEDLDNDETGDTSKVYRGQAGYREYFKMAENYSDKGGTAKGPVRANAWARVSCRFDYQPDICKDYKETGYCGYGDSCKFMHDRGDYKSGWQIEKEWEEEKKKEQLRSLGVAGGEEESQEDSDDEDELPFACFICRESFKNPVVTKCKHYFCEDCALKNFRKSARCFVCNENTGGIFNKAKELIARLKKKEEMQKNREDSDGEADLAEAPEEFKKQDFREQAAAGWTMPGTNTGGL